MSRVTVKSDAWVITLQAEGPGPHTEIRVRRFLKSALRAYGLRCVRVSENGPTTAQGAETQPEATQELAEAGDRS